jgi:hypothetical protein
MYLNVVSFQKEITNPMLLNRGNVRQKVEKLGEVPTRSM